jgi:hypothetical protein
VVLLLHYHASQIIAEAGTTGMTIAKLREAKEIIDLADVDPSLPRHIIVSPKQISDLLGTTEVLQVISIQLKH